MRPLILGPEERERIAAVTTHAHANVIPLARLELIVQGTQAPYYTPDILAEIPVGFRVLYAIEEQPVGLYRHLSASVDGEDRWPHPAAVEAILAAFGMPALAQSAAVWRESHRGRERRNIINVLALYDPGTRQVETAGPCP